MKTFWIAVVLVAPSLLFAQGDAPDDTKTDQIEFPIKIGPGEPFANPLNETLFLINRNQFEKVIAAGLKLRLADSTIAVYEQRDFLRKKLATQKNAIINLNKEGYEHYRQLWEKTDIELEKKEIEAESWKKRTFWSLLGLVVAGVAAAR